MSSFENVNFEKNYVLILPIFGRKTLSTVPFLYHINLNGFFTLYIKEIKIVIWDAELVFSTGLKSGGTPRGSYGGQGGLLFYVGAKPQKVEIFRFTLFLDKIWYLQP